MGVMTAAIDPTVVRRRRTLGVFYVLVGVIIYAFFITSSDPGQMATFGMNPGRVTQAMPIGDITLPVLPGLYVMAAVAVFMGFVQLARGLGRVEGLGIGVVALMLVLAFLTWAARGRSLNLEGVLETAVQRATPIALAALSGVLCERSGIVNIAIEGMMLTAAMVSALVGSVTDSVWVGLIAAVLSAGVLGALLAVLSIRFKVNQIISGTAINILATGGTSYISAKFLAVYTQQLNTPGKFPNLPIPVLSRIPVVGPILFESNIIVYMLFALLIIIHVMLYYTRWGLRTRAVGEHPRAADTLGVNVFRIRYINTILGGMVAGLGGAFLVLGSVPRFR